MKQCIIILLVFQLNVGMSQSLTPQSLNGGGAYQTVPGFSLSYSIGQPSLINTSGSGSFVLTQGFQQSEIIANIIGRIAHVNGKNIPNTVLTTNSTYNTQSNATGNYSFLFSTGNDYTVRAAKNNDITKNNGVSSIDIILTQNHILNKIPFTSPYKIIAADVNNDKKVSAIDIIFMKRVILGIDTTFTGKRLWAFVDSAYTFPNPSNPFPYKDSIIISNLLANTFNQTFLGVKLGDVDFSWNPAIAKPAKANNTPVELNYTDYRSDASKASDRIRIPIRVKNFKELLGMQYTLHFNSDAYEYLGIEKNLLKMDFNGKRLRKNDGQGSISFLWADANNRALTLEDGAVLFELILKPKSGKWAVESDLQLSNDITSIEAYDKDLIKHDVILSKTQPVFFKDSWSISPNPTKGMIQVNMLSTLDKRIRFVLSNSEGKIVLQQTVETIKGSNNFWLNLKKKEMLPAGVYYLRAIGLIEEEAKKIFIW